MPISHRGRCRRSEKTLLPQHRPGGRAAACRGAQPSRLAGCDAGRPDPVLGRCRAIARRQMGSCLRRSDAEGAGTCRAPACPARSEHDRLRTQYPFLRAASVLLFPGPQADPHPDHGIGVHELHAADARGSRKTGWRRSRALRPSPSIHSRRALPRPRARAGTISSSSARCSSIPAIASPTSRRW